MLAIAPYTPSMEDFPDYIAETVSLGVDPNSVFKLPQGCSFVAPTTEGPEKLLLVLPKHDANTSRIAYGYSFFGKSTKSAFFSNFAISQISFAAS